MQCAAVRMCCDVISEPPHFQPMSPSLSVYPMSVIHGMDPLLASTPPTTFVYLTFLAEPQPSSAVSRRATGPFTGAGASGRDGGTTLGVPATNGQHTYADIIQTIIIMYTVYISAQLNAPLAAGTDICHSNCAGTAQIRDWSRAAAARSAAPDSCGC